jgi:GTPase SAR1 family protein
MFPVSSHQSTIIKESFENITRWSQEMDKCTSNDAKKLLVGNKCDRTADRVVEYDKAKVCNKEKKSI